MNCSKSLAVVLLVAVASGGCTDPKKKMEEAQKRRDAEKKKFADEQEAKRVAAIPKIEPAKLEPFWGDAAYVKATNGRPCPDGLWALFPGTPGEGAEQARNEAKRDELAQKVKASTFVAVVHAGGGLSLRKYNAKKKTLSIEVDGVLECFDGLGLLTLAWGAPAKAFRQPKPDDDEEDQQPPQSVWRAQPLLFPLPFATAAEAKRFAETDATGLDARIVFTLGKVDVDKRPIKSGMPLPDAGSLQQTVDWGAGRLVHVNVVGVRVATDHEKHQLLEQRK